MPTNISDGGWTFLGSGGGAPTFPLLAPNGTAGAPSYSFTNDASAGMFLGTLGLSPNITDNGLSVAAFDGSGTDGVRIRSTMPLSWSSGVPSTTASDTFIVRDAANNVALKNGTTAQKFTVYNSTTNTDAADIGWNANVCEIGPNGTAVNRSMRLKAGLLLDLQSGGADAWILGNRGGTSTNFELSPASDASIDIGDASLRVRSVFIATSVQGANTKVLVESAATSFVQISCPSGSAVGGNISYSITANDGTDFQMRSGIVPFSAVNKAGTVTGAVGTPSTATETVAVSAGTLTNAFTAIASGNNVQIQANAVSSLTQTTLNITYRVDVNSGTATVTPQ